MIKYTYITYLMSFNLPEQTTNPRIVNLDSQVIILRVGYRHCHRGITHARTNIQYLWRTPVEKIIQIYLLMTEFNTVFIPIFIECITLAPGNATFTSHIAAYTAVIHGVLNTCRKTGSGSEKSTIDGRRCTCVGPAWNASGKIGLTA